MTLTLSSASPACGRYLEDAEPFDRGFYAGPFGWISGAGAEFVVAIRSALVQDASTADGDLAQGLQGQGSTGGDVAAAHSQVVSLYAGVGVVVGSDPSAEWQVGCEGGRNGMPILWCVGR